MKNNDNLIIMTTARTDNRESDQYNMNLLDERSKSIVQYVISKGIDKSRITGK